MSDETTLPPAVTSDQPVAESIPAAVEALSDDSKTVVGPIPLEDPATGPVSQGQLEALRSKFQDDLDALNQQISLLQLKATALEAQLNSIEPKMEARASRTERLVGELQIEIVKMMKAIAAKEKEKETVERATLTAVQEMKGLLEAFIARPAPSPSNV